MSALKAIAPVLHCARILSLVPMRFAAVITLLACVSGCGYKGPLYLPQQKPQAQQPPAAKPVAEQPAGTDTTVR